MLTWIRKLLHLFKQGRLIKTTIRQTSDAYWLARMRRELAELQKSNATKASTKPREKIFMVNAKERKACILESKGITTINELS